MSYYIPFFSLLIKLLVLICLQCRPISLSWGVGVGTCMPPDQVRLAALINTGMWKRMTFVTTCWYCLRHWNLHWRRLCRSPLSNAVQIADEVESKGCCLRCAVVGHIVRIDVQKHERNWFVTFSACAAGFVKFYYMFGYGRSGDFLYDSADLTICKDSVRNLVSGWTNNVRRDNRRNCCRYHSSVLPMPSTFVQNTV